MSRFVVHCRREKFDVYVGRANPRAGLKASKWGNPFVVPKGYDREKDPDAILAKYEAWLRAQPELMAALPELRNRVLGCWCAPSPLCHAEVLARLANEEPTP